MKDPQIPQPPCPICSEPNTKTYRPFCSKRCADIDLNRWLTGQYIVQTEEEEEELDQTNITIDKDKLN